MLWQLTVMISICRQEEVHLSRLFKELWHFLTWNQLRFSLRKGSIILTILFGIALKLTTHFIIMTLDKLVLNQEKDFLNLALFRLRNFVKVFGKLSYSLKNVGTIEISVCQFQYLFTIMTEVCCHEEVTLQRNIPELCPSFRIRNSI